MIVGDPMLRSRTITSGQPAGNALTFRCFSENFGGNTAAPGGGADTVTFPKNACRGGIRTNIYFPNCWNGKDIDPNDHSVRVSLMFEFFERYDGHEMRMRNANELCVEPYGVGYRNGPTWWTVLLCWDLPVDPSHPCSYCLVRDRVGYASFPRHVA